nr:L,D-transpeptidase [Actinomycetospora corticicola]
MLASAALVLLPTTTASASPVLPPAPPAPVPVAPAAPAPVSPTPCAITAKACMDLSSRQAWLTDGAGHITYGPVAARGGKKGAATPVGTFHVLYRDKDHYSREFDAPMPYSVFFYPGDAFHEDNPNVASNGCIHLRAASAEKFYDTLRTGDEVQVVS